MCIFCEIVERKREADIVYEDEKLLAFRDIYPVSSTHILLIPKQHIDSVNSLQSLPHDQSAELMTSFKRIGLEILNRELEKEQSISGGDGKGTGLVADRNSLFKMGFHVPPFNSINHLHLHLIILPIRGIFGHCKFPGFPVPWFKSLDAVTTWFSQISDTQ